MSLPLKQQGRTSKVICDWPQQRRMKTNIHCFSPLTAHSKFSMKYKTSGWKKTTHESYSIWIFTTATKAEIILFQDNENNNNVDVQTGFVPAAAVDMAPCLWDTVRSASLRFCCPPSQGESTLTETCCCESNCPQSFSSGSNLDQ